MPVIDIISTWSEILEQITAEEINVREFIKIVSIIVIECGVMRVGRV